MKSRRLRISLLFLAATASCFGCDAIQIMRDSMAAQLRGAGLVEQRLGLKDAVIRVWEGGRGPAVLLLHGFGADAVWQWGPQVQALAGKHRLIVPDLLWFGGSFSHLEDYSLDHQVTVMLALLDRLGEQRVDLVGISYGGLVAYELAAAHPDRVRKVVLIDSPGRAYTREDYQDLCRRFKVTSFASVLVPADPKGIKTLMDLAYADPLPVPIALYPAIQRELVEPRRQEKIALLEFVATHMEQFKTRPYDLAKPALLIWGDEDPVFPMAVGRRLAAHLGKKARLEVIPHARHAPNLEHPEEVNAVLKKFLDEP